MALSTRVVLENTQRIKSGLRDQFSVIYTPISTGEYKDYGQDGVSMLLAMVYESIGLCISTVMKSTAEPREDMIELIMKRLGVQKSVMMTRDVVVATVFSCVWTIAIVFVIWGVFFIEQIGLGVLFLFSFLNQAQVILRQQVVSHLLP